MKKLFGGILMAIGILIAGLSGLCSLLFLFGGMLGEGADSLPVILVVGGLPFALGLAFFFGGKAIINAARRDEES